jgi:hypothetical protein
MLLATPVEGTHYLTDMIVGALVALVASMAVRWGLLSLLEERAAIGRDPGYAFLRRTRNGELIHLLARESSNGPRAVAIFDEIERRRLD